MGGIQSQAPAPRRSGHPWGASRVRSLPQGGVGTPGWCPESGPCPREEWEPLGGVQSQVPALGRSRCPGEEWASLGGIQSQAPAPWRRAHPGSICPRGDCARRNVSPAPGQPAGSSPQAQVVPGKGGEDSSPSSPSVGLGVSHGRLRVASQPPVHQPPIRKT